MEDASAFSGLEIPNRKAHWSHPTLGLSVWSDFPWRPSFLRTMEQSVLPLALHFLPIWENVFLPHSSLPLNYWSPLHNFMNRLQWSSEHSPRGLCSAALLAPGIFLSAGCASEVTASLPENFYFFLPCLLWWELTPLKSTPGSVSTRWILPETEASTSELFLLNNIGRHRYGGNPSLGWMHLFQSQVLGQKSSLYPPTHPAPTSKSMSLSHHLSTACRSRYVLSLRG